MDRYPVAGNVIQFQLWFGVSARDAIEAFAVPLAFIAAPRYLPLIPFGAGTGAIFGLVGIFAGILLLYIKPEGQRPWQYLKAVFFFHLTTNTYYFRRRRENELGKIQDVPISQINKKYQKENED